MLGLISTTRRRAVTRDYPCFAHAELLWSGCRIGTWAGIGVEEKKRRNQKEEVSGNTKPSHVSQSGYSVYPTKTRLTSYSLIWGGLTNLRFLRKPLFEWMRCVPPNVSKTRVLQYPSRSCPRPVLLRRSNQTFIHWKWKQ